MLDLKLIRAETESVRAALRRRGIADLDERIHSLLELDEQRRVAIQEVNDLKARRNDVSRQVGELKRGGEPADELIAEMRGIRERIGDLDGTVSAREAGIRVALLDLPNLPLEQVPEGGEDDNELIRTWGEVPELAFEARAHWDLGEALGILDPQRAAKLSGSGFSILRGQAARLQRGLINFMLDMHTQEHGYVEVQVPYLVTTETLTGTGQLPKFADESYVAERDDLWLIPTAEVPVTNMHRDEILDAAQLPLKYTACTACFRREAGAAGKDTRGLIRMHQFDKVELVRFETPERSEEALEELTHEAETVLQRLGLAYRVVRLATGDLGFSSAHTYDLEVWAPGVGRWLEVSSCSTFMDFQARRANVRYRPAQGEKPVFLHTLNGSGLALPRLMIALLESYQQEDGSVVIPDALRPFVGFDRIVP